MGNEIAVSTVTGDDLQVTAKLYNYYNLPLRVILVYRIALCPNWYLQITFILHKDIHSAEIFICQTGKDFREASWNSFFSGSQKTGGWIIYGLFLTPSFTGFVIVLVKY